MERSTPQTRPALDLDPDRVTYTPLGELGTATEKAGGTPPPSPSARSNALPASAPAIRGNGIGVEVPTQAVAKLCFTDAANGAARRERSWMM